MYYAQIIFLLFMAAMIILPSAMIVYFLGWRELPEFWKDVWEKFMK